MTRKDIILIAIITVLAVTSIFQALEIHKINTSLQNIDNAVDEIKDDTSDLNEKISNSESGLQEMKNDLEDIKERVHIE